MHADIHQLITQFLVLILKLVDDLLGVRLPEMHLGVILLFLGGSPVVPLETLFKFLDLLLVVGLHPIEGLLALAFHLLQLGFVGFNSSAVKIFPVLGKPFEFIDALLLLFDCFLHLAQTVFHGIHALLHGTTSLAPGL